MADTGTKGKASNDEESQPIMFFTFGMFIIDEIEFLPSLSPPRPTLYNLPGGAGLYSLLGARLLLPPPHSTRASWILDTGADIPTSITTQLSTWSTSTTIRHDPTRQTTRAWNGYGAHEKREFKYLTPKKRLDVEDLDELGRGDVLRGKGWHLVCSPQRCSDVVSKLRLRRARLGCGALGEGMVVVWEPIPDLCSPSELVRLKGAAGLVDVVSPNADELRSFFGVSTVDGGGGGGMEQDELVVRLMGWADYDGVVSATRNTACVVREGKDGSTIYFPPGWWPTSPSWNKAKLSQVHKLHLPAYHIAGQADQVIDPTGGGNTFLGGLAVSMAYTFPFNTPFPPSSGALTSSPPTTRQPSPALPPVIETVQGYIISLSPSLPAKYASLISASVLACIAASFAIEQTGVPALTMEESEEEEKWGPGSVRERVEEYLAREGGDIEKQIRDILGQ